MKPESEPFMMIFGTIRLLMNHIGPQRTEMVASLGMTPIHHMTLVFIKHNEGCKMTDVAKEFSLSPAAVTRTANNLIEHGLVERFYDKGDRRIIRLKMTKSGNKAMKKGKQEMDALLSKVIKKMDKEDYKALMQGLSALSRAIKKMEQET